MKIEQVKINDVFPYLRNAKKHDKTQIANVAESIKQFGMVQPIVVDKDNNVIIGHCRLLACKQLKMKEVPIVKLEDLTPEEANKLRLLDNKLNESEWDFNLLAEDVPSLDFDGFDIDWEIPEVETTDEKEIIEDEAPEPPAEPTTKLGDLWQLGSHRLICGDSTDVAVIDRLMDGVKADMVFCDAPYGYKYESNYQDKYEMLQNDDKILDFIPAIWGAMKDNCPVYEFCGWQSLKQWLEYFENTSLDLKNVIIWKKNNWSMGDLKGAYAGQYEVILYLNKGRVELNGARDTDIWEFDREPPKMHPTMKPIELIAYALNKSSKKGDVVLDCFGGSGSTLIACEQTGRTCYMAELSPEYVDVIIARYEKLTGQKAVRIDAEETE
jgi:site-specific DNA-methyltransferase (adenine-specific)